MSLEPKASGLKRENIKCIIGSKDIVYLQNRCYQVLPAKCLGVLKRQGDIWRGALTEKGTSVFKAHSILIMDTRSWQVSECLAACFLTQWRYGGFNL